MRHLATIQRVLDIKPIEGADRIEVAKIKGWQCVVGKGQFNVGDQVIFLEIDSVTPQTETYALLKDSGYRVRTRRFRKQISQGLCLPVHSTLADKYLPLCEQLGTSPLPDETDVTTLLGITQYQPYVPAQLSGIVKGNFPEFLHKTDEERIQNVPEILEKYKGKEFSVTEKLDGSSFTAFYNNGEFGVCSRNLELKQDDNNAFWKTALELDLKGRLIALGGNHSVQGELVGMGIQGNKYKLDKIKLFIFNLFNIDRNKFYDADDYIRLVREMGLETVPVLNRKHILKESLDELITLSNAPSVLNPSTPREGIVLRPIYETYDDILKGRLSFKIINPEFLLTHGE